MAIYITGEISGQQLNYSTGNASSIKRDLNISLVDISGLNNIVYTTGNQVISGNKDFDNRINVSGIVFDTILPENSPAYQQGMVFYSDDSHTLNIYPDVSGLSLPVGQKSWVRVKNGLAQTVNVGSVVYITGGNGNNPGIQLSIASNEAGSAKTLGIVSNTMLPSEPGYVTTFGIVNGINTTQYPVGTTLYLSPTGSGQFTSQKPVAPNHMVRVGTILTSKNDGSIFVTVQNGFELNELHDILIQSPVSGQSIVYDGTLWRNQFNVQSASIENVVYTTGNQTISGIKTFTSRPNVNGTPVALSGDSTALLTNSLSGSLYVDGNIYSTGDIYSSGARVITSFSGDSEPAYVIRVMTQSGYDYLASISGTNPNTLYFIT